MFIYDRPIETDKDDFLERNRFSQHLGNALLNWQEKESLVIAIYGEWGSGKSSIINLAVESIERSNHQYKPIIIEFNPWMFSEDKGLSTHFFNELAKELEIKKCFDNDKKIADNLKLYSKLLNLTPTKDTLNSICSKSFMGLGVIGISTSQIIQWLQIPSDWIKYITLVIGLILFSIGIFKKLLVGISDFFEQKFKINKKSVTELKNKIKKELFERNKKIVIVIDDIDRLNQSEIRKIFRLIRINADFPNTIYLLAFDRKIIEKNLEEQVGVSGKDYLNKIVQVNFDVPFAVPSKISAFLLKELDRVLYVLPESAQNFFDDEDSYWINIYNSGFKDFFNNIREVKRFISSLEFNISQMYQGKVMEVNPIDFIGIEAIRVFAPDFYLFMRNGYMLFTSTGRQSAGTDDPRKIEIEKALKELSNGKEKAISELIRRLFPQLDSLFQPGSPSYGSQWQSNWSKKLRVCSIKNFDSYFTLIPGGDGEELSQFEIEDILDKSSSKEKFEQTIREYIVKGKIRKVLQRIQDFADDISRIPQENAINVVSVLFNISDDLPEEKSGMWDFGIDRDLMIVIDKLLKREADKNKNLNLLEGAILQSSSIFGPVCRIALESSQKKEGNDYNELAVPENEIDKLQKLCLEKIKGTSTDGLLQHRKLLYILYRWQEWDSDKNWEKFIKEITRNEARLLLFITKFISEVKSQAINDYAVKRTAKFNYEGLNNFIDLIDIKTKLEKIKKQNNEIYQSNKQTIDLFLNNFEKKDQQDDID